MGDQNLFKRMASEPKFGNDDNEYYCNDADLKNKLKQLQERELQVGAIFNKFDVDKDKLLNKSEMYKFAQRIGFEDPIDEFEAEWEDLAKENKFRKENGLDIKVFMALMSDPDGDYHVEQTY